jgi:hypothetical protein
MKMRVGILILVAMASFGFAAATVTPTSTATPEILDFDYLVKKGDSLSKIAAMDFVAGQSSQWTKVYGLNREEIKDPNLILPGMKIKVRVALKGPVGDYYHSTGEKRSDGSKLLKVLSTVTALGPGPRSTEVTASEAMEFFDLVVFDSRGNTVERIKLEPVDKDRILWRKYWWMDDNVFKDGEVYHMFQDGSDLAGNALASPSGDPNVLLPEDINATTSHKHLPYMFSFRFNKALPNKNLAQPWAQALSKEHSEKH